jgi:hypothetical protein
VVQICGWRGRELGMLSCWVVCCICAGRGCWAASVLSTAVWEQGLVLHCQCCVCHLQETPIYQACAEDVLASVLLPPRKPRPTNLDYFTKALLHRDLEVYAERKAQQQA